MRRRAAKTEAEPDVIEAEYQEMPNEPAPGLGRADVLAAARVLNSQVIGLAAAVESAALTPGRVRPEFLAPWRAWSGSWLACAARLETTDPIDPQAEARRVAGYAQNLGAWRQALAAELGAAARVGQAEPEIKPLDQIAAGSWRRWPWWIVAPAGLGVCIGSYMSVRWMFRVFMNMVNEAGDREQHGERKE